MDAKYIVKTSAQDFPAVRFRDANTIACMLETEGIGFGIWSILEGDWVDEKRPTVPSASPQGTRGRVAAFPERREGAPSARLKEKAVGAAALPKRRGVKCEASNYKFMQDDRFLPSFAWIIDVNDHREMAEEGYCSCCGKRVKMRRFGSVGLIPAHNINTEGWPWGESES